MAQERVHSRWWLSGGDEECPHCEQSYAHDVEVRCAECDEAMCPLCVKRVGKRSVCPECARGGEA